jgi:DNA-binding NarL/FixJ family response regulator
VLLLASDSKTLCQRWLAALGTDAAEAVVPAGLTERLVTGTVGVCAFDLGEQPEAGQQPLLRLLQAFPAVAFIALAAAPSASQGVALLQAGARGYCNRLAAPELIPVVVQTVRAGELWVGQQVAQHLLARQTHATPRPRAGLLDDLTPREREIARLVGEGLSNKVIAARGGITERTVKAHLNAIFRKTGISNRVQLALIAADPDAPEGQLAHA